MKARRTTGNRRKGADAASRHHLLELNVRTASVRRQRRGKAMGILRRTSAALLVIAVTAVGVRFPGPALLLRQPRVRPDPSGPPSQRRHDRRGTHRAHRTATRKEHPPTRSRRGKQASLGTSRSPFRKHRAPPCPAPSRWASKGVIPCSCWAPGRREPVPEAKSDAVGGGNIPEGSESGKSFLCDADGVVMRPGHQWDEFTNLPVLTGIDVASLQPGQRLEGDSFPERRRRHRGALRPPRGDVPDQVRGCFQTLRRDRDRFMRRPASPSA